MWGEIVPLVRCNAVQAKVSVVEDRAVERTPTVFVCIGADKGCLGPPHQPGDDPRDTVRAVLAIEQAVTFPLVLFQHIYAKEFHCAQ